MPKIPEISVGIQMEKFSSVSFDRNIWDHLWRWPHISVGIFRPKFVVPLKEFKMTTAISIGWPVDLIGKCRSIFL